MKNKKITWVGILVLRNKKVLMVKENDIDFLVFPGGEMEQGETLEQTLRREINEELGTWPINFNKYLEIDLPGRAEGVQIHFVVYKGELDGETNKGEDIEKLFWLDSNFEKLGHQVGHLASLSVLPKLKFDGLID